MRRFLPLLAFCLGLAGLFAPAQIRVTMSLPTDTFLVYEGIPLTLRIDNNTFSPLLVGGSNATARLRIDVQDVDGHSIPVTGRAPLDETWYVPSHGVGTNQFDLVGLYHIRRAGAYRVRVYLTPLGDDTHASGVHLFDVVNGVELEAMKLRRDDRYFRLVELNRNRGDQLLFQVSSADGKQIFYTYVLEKYMRFYPPELQRDKEGQIHTLHYRDIRTAVHCIFDREGRAVARQYHSVPQGQGRRVTLVKGGEHGMQVLGGKALNP